MTNREPIQAEVGMRILDGVPVWGDPVDEAALAQIKKTAEHEAVVGVALMADHHKGYAVPIGGVVAYQDAISPSGVGYDIACGNKAVLTDMLGSEARANIATIMDDIWSTLSFGVGRKNEEKVDHDLFDDPAWSVISKLNLRDKAAAQLGTIGSGNHYVDILIDEQERVWVGVHFGSRGFGHGIATWALKEGGASYGMDVAPLVLPVSSALGQDYLAAMALAGRYAYAGRDWVCERVVKILGASILDEVHNHHNFAWQEWHGRDVWVVRKGATPAFPGQRGFVGGSMGDDAVIIQGSGEPVGKLSVSDSNVSGREGRRSNPSALLPDKNEAPEYAPTPEQPPSFYSTVHGAGRVMGRMQAKGKVKKGVVVRPGLISREDMRAWLTERNVELRGSDVDEAPQAYKRLPDVLRHHGGSINVLHALTPIGVAMAGEREFDPYKD